MHRIFLLLLLIMVFGCRSAPATPESLFRSNEFRKAISLCEQLINNKDDTANTYFWLGRVHLRSKEPDIAKAIENLEKAVTKEPNKEIYLLWLAKAYESKAYELASRKDKEARKYIKDAMSKYDEVIKINQNSAEAYLLRGALYMRMNERDKAKMDFESALVLEPTVTPDEKTADYFHALGYARFLLKKYKQAVSDFDRALELDPFLATAYHDRALAYDLVGYSIRALDDFNRAIDLSPKEHKYYSNRAKFYITLGLYDKAIEDAGKAISINPQNSHAYRMQGLAYMYTKQADDAVGSIKKSLGIEEIRASDIEGWPRPNAHGLHYLANLCLRFPEEIGKTGFGGNEAYGCYDKAEKIAGKLVDIKPNEAEGYLDRALVNWSRIETSENKDALWNGVEGQDIIEDLNRTVDNDPGEAYAYLLLGDAHSKRGEVDKAIGAYTEAIDLEPEYAIPYLRRGEIYFTQEEYDKAKADFDKAHMYRITSEWRDAVEEKLDQVTVKLKEEEAQRKGVKGS